MPSKHVLLSVILASVAGLTGAKDLGVAGKTWPITEEDLRKVLASELSEKDPTEFNRKLKDSAKNFVSNLPKREFSVVERTTTNYVDLSIELTSDIQGPVKKADGTFSWEVLWPKGTKVNPLEKVTMVEAILFFDGGDPEQLQFMTQALKAFPERLTVVEAGTGDLNEDTKKAGRPVFYANDLMLDKFKIAHLPTLVYPGEGANKAYLGNTAYARPYTVGALELTWSPFKKSE